MVQYNTNNNDNELLLKTINDSLVVKSHFQLFSWLQGSVQHFLPHDILISAWGDFSLGLIYIDVVALHPLIRTNNIDKTLFEPKIIELFGLWQSHNNQPLLLNIEDGYLNIGDAIKMAQTNDDLGHQNINEMNAAILHGVKDNRGSYDCLYIMLSEKSIPVESKSKMAIFMPFIDCAFRQILQLDNDDPADSIVDTSVSPNLTAREVEIMDLIREGKSNDEVSNDLDISIFTVKNHLQRIYKKLDVINRSQATYKYRSFKDDNQQKKS